MVFVVLICFAENPEQSDALSPAYLDGIKQEGETFYELLLFF